MKKCKNCLSVQWISLFLDMETIKLMDDLYERLNCNSYSELVKKMVIFLSKHPGRLDNV
jgi:hypothetical protein